MVQFPPSGALVPDPGLCGGDDEAAEPRGAELLLLPRQSGLQVRTHLELCSSSSALMFSLLMQGSGCWLSVSQVDLGSLILTRDISHMFRARANRRWYRAELELHASIAAESCCWEVKCNQPVLKLVKQQQGYWDRFLRNKVLNKFSLRLMVRLLSAWNQQLLPLAEHFCELRHGAL